MYRKSSPFKKCQSFVVNSDFCKKMFFSEFFMIFHCYNHRFLPNLTKSYSKKQIVDKKHSRVEYYNKHNLRIIYFKVRLSPSKNDCVIYFIESPLKMMKNAFYFILKTLFVLKIFKFLS